MAGFSQIYEQYAEQVYCFLRELSGNDGLAEELTWRTFYQAFLHVDSFENRSGVFDWLCEIGENVYLKEMKRRKINTPWKRQITAFERDEAGGGMNAAERKARMRQGLRRIRRRWACSVIAAGIVLLLLMGVMLIVGGAFEE